MKVLLTGATGFTGSFVLDLLLARGIETRCLVRKTSNRERLPGQVEAVEGDAGDEASLVRALAGVDALVNVASLGFGHAPAVVRAAEIAGVKRAIFVSSTAIFTQLNAPSKAVRMAAEERITSSRLAYTILRPTMIYGTSRDRNMCRLIRYLSRYPVLPIVGSGERLQQPVHVADVAAGVLGALHCEASVRRAYNLSGGTVLTFQEVVATITRLLGRKVLRLHLPVRPAIAALTMTERLRMRLPIKAEQLLRLNEDKVFPHDEASNDFGYAPISFEEGIRRELAEMGLG